MNAHIAGVAWVTPLGADRDAVWARLKNGDQPEVRTAANPETGKLHRSIPVPAKFVEAVARNPRLRRSSAISYFGVAAGRAAFEAAGVEVTPEIAARTAVVFAITDGGVLYTRRFYEQIVKQGANSASPLLFPETVYNAPASHLAAHLGIDGASYTIVGDGAVGLNALHFGAQLLATSEIDHCVVVGAEECDWILCEAYDEWRFARTPLAEGAAAILLSRSGAHRVQTDPGATFFRQRDAAAALQTVLTRLPLDANVTLAVCSANGSFIDRAEEAALKRLLPDAQRLHPKESFGEAPGASALLQTVAAVLAIETDEHAKALVTAVGMNHHANAALIERVS